MEKPQQQQQQQQQRMKRRGVSPLTPPPGTITVLLGVTLFLLVLTTTTTTAAAAAANGALAEIEASALPTPRAVFLETPICDLDYVRGSQGSDCIAKIDGGVRGMTECASLCGDNNLCFGVSTDTTGTACFHHYDPDTGSCYTPSTNGCDELSGSGGGAGGTFLVRRCVHGHWNAVVETCICVDGAYGTRCEKYPQFCRDRVIMPLTKGAFWTLLDPAQDGKHPFRVVCEITDVSSGAAKMRVFTNTGRDNFNRTWNEYVNGFPGDDRVNWIGLRAWHEMTNVGCITFSVTLSYTTADTVSIKLRSDYPDFYLEGEENGYSFSLVMAGEKNEIPDCFTPMSGASFLTFDSNTDAMKANTITSEAGSGWWYDNDREEGPCHLLGSFSDPYNSIGVQERLRIDGFDINFGDDLETIWDNINVVRGDLEC